MMIRLELDDVQWSALLRYATERGERRLPSLIREVLDTHIGLAPAPRADRRARRRSRPCPPDRKTERLERSLEALSQHIGVVEPPRGGPHTRRPTTARNR